MHIQILNLLNLKAIQSPHLDLSIAVLIYTLSAILFFKFIIPIVDKFKT